MEVLIRDETTAGATTHEMALEFIEERITMRELIRSRVYQEVKDYNNVDLADDMWISEEEI